MNGQKFVEVQNLRKYFKTAGGMLHAVDDVTLAINRGKTMGVVGESGCGKSTLGRTIIHLLDSNGGEIYFDGKNITNLKRSELRKFREDAGIIFQDPFSSLDPRFTVEEIIQEPLKISKKYSKSQLQERTTELMEMVGIDKRLALSYPHELDGGRRQRVGIARSMALNPKFIVCDEPVSALDVSIQAQVLNLLQDLQEQQGLTYMFVTHNMSVVRHISNEICVMYLGQLVETAQTDTIFERPFHPYTKALLSAIPSTDITKAEEHIHLKGELTSPINPKAGCRFSKRCDFRKEECNQTQSLTDVESGHFVSCCRAKELNKL
jgi:peptide/nickel transport system ATP-binding protein